MKVREKNYNLELIRTISFIMVIVIHVTNYYCRAFGKISVGEYGISLLLDTIARVSVPCFFMISGALLLGKEESLQKSRDRLIRFVIVLFFWSIIYYLHNVFYMEATYNWLKLLYVPTEPHLWYLYAMIPIYIVLPFLQIMCRPMDKKLDQAFLIMSVCVVILMYILSIFDAELYYDVPLFGDRGYSFYFFMGYFLNKYKNDSRIQTKYLVAVFLLSNLVNVIGTAYMSWKIGNHYERFLEYGCPLIILSGVSFFLFMLRLGDGKLKLKIRTKYWIDVWSANSFGIYLIHILFLDNYKKYMDADMVSAYVAIPVLTIGILTVSFFCIYIIRKTTIGRKIS